MASILIGPARAADDPKHAETRCFRVSEVVSALTYALDLTEGQPAGHTLRACCIGMRIARELHLGDEASSSLFYTVLLKDTGCSSNAAAVAAMFATDDRVVKRDTKVSNWTTLRGGAGYVWRNAAQGHGHWRRLRHFARIATGGETSARELVRIRCERGASIVGRLGFGPAVTESIRSLDEHWDGSGHPDGLRGRAIPLNARIALLAQTLEVFLAAGAGEAIDVVRTRKATWFDPELVDLVGRWHDDEDWWRALTTGDAAEMVAALEPRDIVRTIDDNGLDRIAAAFAEVIDAKSPYTYNHSSGVAEWACRIGVELDLDEVELRSLRRAGLLHDIGKLGVSNRILDKPGRLTGAELAEIRRHPDWTWDILRRVPAFASFARAAALHHERLDGSGYPWGLAADGLDECSRILGVADVFEALTADRPYRPGLPIETVLEILRRETPRLHDPRVVEALETAARRRH